MQTSGKKACFQFPECSLPYAKVMQTSGKKACFQFPECSLPYAKVMQTSGKKACFQFPECSLPYAKVRKFPDIGMIYGKLLSDKSALSRTADIFSHGGRQEFGAVHIDIETDNHIA